MPLPLPRWVYRPGSGIPDRETLEAAKALVPRRFDGAVPADHPGLLYGLDLNDGGFFWECHEVLEAVWKAAPQRGRDRILLRACIQIANANLKDAMQQPRAAARLFEEARAELAELERRQPDVAGFAASYPSALLVQRLADQEPPVPITGSAMHKNAGTGTRHSP